MVNDANQHSGRRRVNQGVHADIPKANKIGASTPYNFEAHNLTAYGGLLPVATMLEKLGFQQLIEEETVLFLFMFFSAFRQSDAFMAACRPASPETRNSEVNLCVY